MYFNIHNQNNNSKKYHFFSWDLSSLSPTFRADSSWVRYRFVQLMWGHFENETFPCASAQLHSWTRKHWGLKKLLHLQETRNKPRAQQKHFALGSGTAVTTSHWATATSFSKALEETVTPSFSQQHNMLQKPQGLGAALRLRSHQRANTKRRGTGTLKAHRVPMAAPLPQQQDAPGSPHLVQTRTKMLSEVCAPLATALH